MAYEIAMALENMHFCYPSLVNEYLFTIIVS
jgi:hypothetical protein